MAKNNNTIKQNPVPSGHVAAKADKEILKPNSLLQKKLPAFMQFFTKTKLCALIVALVSIAIYTNTFSHQFAVDDAIVITRNQFTRQGLKGMKGIWTEDTFVGFFGKQQNLVSGGRYRPFSLATFALEMELFGDHAKHPISKEYLKGADGDYLKDANGNYLYDIDPMYGHVINVLLYALLCVMIYYTILQLMRAKYGLIHQNSSEDNIFGEGSSAFVAFACALLYATHPVHTEAIANIKGRDEILVMMGSIMALHYTVKAFLFKNKYLPYLGLAILGFLMGIFSKESAIPFLAVIPAALYIFVPNTTLKDSLKATAPFFAITLVFWFAIRGPILEIKDPNDPMAKVLTELSENMYKNHKTAFFWIKNEPTELMNNPFLKLENGRYLPYNDSERLGTILYTWKEYLRLLAFPATLTNDYYPYHIAIEAKNVGNNVVPTAFVIPTMQHGGPLLSLVLHAALGIFGLVLCYRRNIYGFCILFYFATFSVVSNFFFPIGTNMAERFLFMPSLAFSLACAVFLCNLAAQEKYKNFVLPILVLVSTLYSVKTFARNFAWENDYVLFTTDIANSPHSAKLNNAVSGVIQDRLNMNPQISEQERFDELQKALRYSTTAIKMHPTYNNAWLLYGNSNTLLSGIFAKMPKGSNGTTMINGSMVSQSSLDLAILHIDQAIAAYQEVLRLRPDHQDAPNNLAIALMDKGNIYISNMNNVAEATRYFELSVQYAPNNPNTHRLLGTAYAFAQNTEKAKYHLEQSLALMPNQVAVLYNLSVLYAQIGDSVKSNQLLQEVQRLDPQYYQSVTQPQ